MWHPGTYVTYEYYLNIEKIILTQLYRIIQTDKKVSVKFVVFLRFIFKRIIPSSDLFSYKLLVS